MNKEGAKGEALRKMQEAAWAANRGRPRSQATKERIRATRIKKCKEKGVPFSPYLDNLPLTVRDNHWYAFLPGRKRVPHARLVYEKYIGPIPTGYIIHHIDGDCLNDAPHNLIALPRKEHYYLHLYWEIVDHWENKPHNGKIIFDKYMKWRTQ